MRKTFGGILIVFCLFGLVSAVFAHTYNGTVAITCTDFTAAGTGPDVLDRDNTGSGEEVFASTSAMAPERSCIRFRFRTPLGAIPEA